MSLPASTATPGCLLFRPSSARSGVLGHDGAYSLPLGDKRSLWFFGDTFVGTSSPTGARQVDSWVRNTSALTQDADFASCFAEASYSGNPVQETLVHPDEEDVQRRAAWSGDVIRIGSDIWLYYSVFDIGTEGALDFVAVGHGVVRGHGDPPRFTRSSPERFLFSAREPQFGQAAFVHQNEIYVYGTRDKYDPAGHLYKEILLAKVDPMLIEERGGYRYFVKLDGGKP